MKFRYLISALFLCLAVSCVEEGFGTLSEIQLSQSYAAIDVNGGSASITATANDSWTVVESSVPSWLTVSPMSGSSGETTITFSAEATTATNEADVQILCGGKTQHISVIQFAVKGEPVILSCREAIDLIKSGNYGGSEYYVKGIVCKIQEIDTGSYGNATFFLSDDGTYQGSYNSDGSGDGNWFEVYRSWWLNGEKFKTGNEFSLGDEITVCGVLTSYKGTPETLQDTNAGIAASVVAITKSLISVDKDNVEIGKDGGNLDVKVVYKGNDLKVNPDVDWISLANINVASDTTYVTLKVDPNIDDTRFGKIELSSSIPGQSSSVTINLKQASGLDMYHMSFFEDFSNGLGSFAVNVITPRPDGKDIWSVGSYNGQSYVKASAGSKVDTKSMLVSPKFNLNGVTSPVLSFDHCGKFCGDQAEELTLWVSTDNCETWTQLLIPNAHDNNYGWINSGDISLASFAGKDYLNFAFQYVSNSDYYGTWEITNVKVEDRAPVFTSIAALNNAASSAKVTYDVTLTDAVVKYVNGGNAFIEDATGGIQLYKSNHGLKAGQKINGKAKFTVTLYNMYAEATDVDFSEATVTEDGNVDPTVLTVNRLLKDYLRYQNCFVKLEGVKFANGADGSAKVSDTLSQGEDTVASYTQVKTVKIEANKEYDVLCLPTRYKTTLQVGIWEDGHLIAK